MGREGAKGHTHLIKTQWHAKTEATGGRESPDSSHTLGSLSIPPEPGKKLEDGGLEPKGAPRDETGISFNSVRPQLANCTNYHGLCFLGIS